MTRVRRSATWSQIVLCVLLAAELQWRRVEAAPQAPVDIQAVTKSVVVSGLTFPVVDQGQGPAVILLHGFPDSRFVWRNQIGPLVEAGFRVIVPDFRGFGDAPKPAAVDEYRFPVVARDVIGILDALNLRSVRVVGHDFGAGLAWYLAATYPDRVERLVALSVGAGGTSGTGTIAQREKSWYWLFFQFEGVAETALAMNDWRLFKELTRGQGDTERYIRDLSRPGALTAALNWYRANVRPQPPPESPQPLPKIACPTLGIWSDGDPFITEGHVSRSVERMAGPWRYERITGAGHWMMLDKPAELNRLLLEFLRP